MKKNLLVFGFFFFLIFPAGFSHNLSLHAPIPGVQVQTEPTKKEKIEGTKPNLTPSHPENQIRVITIDNYWKLWVFDPALLMLSLWTFLYWNYLRKQGQKRRKYPTEKDLFQTDWVASFCFFSSLVVIALALCSPIAFLSDINFSSHMIEHSLLMLVAAPLFVAGKAFPFLLQGTPRIFLPWVVWLGKSKILHKIFSFLTFPVVSLGLYLLNLALWHIPFFYNLTLTNQLIHYLEHILMFIFGVLFWWNIFSPYKNLKGLQFIPYLFVPLVFDNAFSGIITFANSDIYAYPPTISLGLNTFEHQRLGGALMFMFGSTINMTVMAVLFLKEFQKQNPAKDFLQIASENPKLENS